MHLDKILCRRTSHGISATVNALYVNGYDVRCKSHFHKYMCEYQVIFYQEMMFPHGLPMQEMHT